MLSGLPNSTELPSRLPNKVQKNLVRPIGVNFGLIGKLEYVPGF